MMPPHGAAGHECQQTRIIRTTARREPGLANVAGPEGPHQSAFCRRWPFLLHDDDAMLGSTLKHGTSVRAWLSLSTRTMLRLDSENITISEDYCEGVWVGFRCTQSSLLYGVEGVPPSRTS
jgi:hypothetical protein